MDNSPAHRLTPVDGPCGYVSCPQFLETDALRDGQPDWVAHTPLAPL